MAYAQIKLPKNRNAKVLGGICQIKVPTNTSHSKNKLNQHETEAPRTRKIESPKFELPSQIPNQLCTNQNTISCTNQNTTLHFKDKNEL